MLITTKVKDFESFYDGRVIRAKSDASLGQLENNELIHFFDGVQTAINFILEHYPKAKHTGSSSDVGSGEFNYFESYEEAVDTFLHHPADIVKFNKTYLDPKEHQEKGTDLEYGTTGDFIDIGRVVEGNPEDFGYLTMGNPRHRRVRIVANIGMTSAYDASDMNRRSERLIRLVNALEEANIPVEFTAVYSSRCNHMEIIVKRFNEILIAEDVAIVTNPDFPRRLGFRLSEYSDTYSYGYGSSRGFEANLKTIKSVFNDELTVYVDAEMYASQSDQFFDELEPLLVKELSEIVPKTSLFTVTRFGVKQEDF